MLIWLCHLFHDCLPAQQNHVGRCFLAFVTAFFIVLLLGKSCIRYLQKLQCEQAIRNDGPQSHLAKAGTPTMGGVLIIFAILVSCLLWGDLANQYLWIALLITLGFTIIGGVDDYRKVVQKNPKGLPAKWKYFWQSILAIVCAIVLYHWLHAHQATALHIPFFHVAIPLTMFSIVVSYFVIVGGSNAVNLTDGLDGLAVAPVALVAAGLAILAYANGHWNLTELLHHAFVPGSSEMMIFAGAIIGSCLGFLWFNSHPAQVFMGDVGSLPLGAALGVIAIILRQELQLAIMGMIFVAEAVSVILQVGSYKLRQKRIFKMAPLHHHFELCGWPETKVVIRFWLVTVIFVLLGLSSLLW